MLFRSYPKLQIAVPFTPVPGPRLLLRDEALAPALIAGIEALSDNNRLSSAHATFVDERQIALFERAGWLVRAGTQFHWHNRGYADFDAFLGDLSSRKRKAIRKERERALDGLTIRHLSGPEITEAHWDAFWDFYQDTGSRKWGHPYQTRPIFSVSGATMRQLGILILGGDGISAEQQGRAAHQGGRPEPGTRRFQTLIKGHRFDCGEGATRG